MEELDVETMLAVLDRSVSSLPEEGRSEARRDVLAFYAALYRNAGAPVPLWVRVGQDRDADATRGPNSWSPYR